MTEEIINAILNNFLAVDDLFEWLSKKYVQKSNEAFPKQFEFQCSQVEFVSNFLMYLRDKISRDFQIYDAETPKKSSCARSYRNTSATEENSSCFEKSNSICYNSPNIDPFHTLSSSSSNKIFRKSQQSTPNNYIDENGTRGNFERKSRRIKLFSDVVEDNSKKIDPQNQDIKFLDNMYTEYKNKFTSSTPKDWKCNSTSQSDIDYVNALDSSNTSFNSLNKSLIDSHTSSFSNYQTDFLPTKSISFSDESSYKTRENKSSTGLCLGDFIVNDVNIKNNKKEKKGKMKKRIQTQRLSTQSSFTEKVEDVFNSEEISSNFKSSVKHFNDNLEQKFEDLNIEKLNNGSPPGLPSTHNEPELKNVTFANELKILSRIYSFLISENFCQNILMEFCFIISLLVIQTHNKKNVGVPLSSSEGKYFESIHNCVFFAVETLSHQKHCLLLLNLSTLKLLSENVRIEKFNRELKEFLMNAYYQKQVSEEVKRRQGLPKTGMQGNVSFQYETDNRENFTSVWSFHAFRKQRDLFYNILAIWEANHLTSGWIFTVALGSKIRSLLTISSDPINLLHFSRLFRNQLVMSCCGENQLEEDLNEKILQLLPTADPNKIIRLRARLTGSPKRQGPCPLPDFAGYQEFYKDFILCINHNSFHQHLKNSLCDEIIRLNDTDLTEDIEGQESSLDEQRYLQSTNILRLLAKFLGFVEFLPYSGEKPYSDKILNIHCSVRHNALPLFDIVACLLSAVKKRKLTLTIPWIVSYLSMIDHYSARLKIYENVWKMLITIYKNLNDFKNSKSCFYLKLNLGYIFQLPNFPSEQFYSVLENSNDCSLAIMSEEEEVKEGLDSYDFVQDGVLYSVCPYLNEINVILSENSGCNVRHIKPVTTQKNSCTKSQITKQLELRLEGNFLHNQSSSTRKTVEFITERVASIITKEMIYKIIPKIKKAAWTELDSLSIKDMDEAETISEKMSLTYYEELYSVCKKEAWKISIKRSELAMEVLLSSDLHQSVVETCSKIVARQAVEKVEKWMQSHLTHTMIKNDFVSRIQKKLTKKLPEGQISVLDCAKDFSYSPHCEINALDEESAWPASQTMKALRECICKVYEGDGDNVEVEMLFEEVTKTLKHRKYTLPAAERVLYSLILDLVVMLCIYSGNNNLESIFKKLILLLKGFPPQEFTNLQRIICPRNVSIVLREAKEKEKAWRNLGSLLLQLLEENLITKEQLESQLLFFFRHNYNKEDGNQYLKFISIMLEQYLRKHGCDQLSLLLEYMIETINENELSPYGLP